MRGHFTGWLASGDQSLPVSFILIWYHCSHQLFSLLMKLSTTPAFMLAVTFVQHGMKCRMLSLLCPFPALITRRSQMTLSASELLRFLGTQRPFSSVLFPQDSGSGKPCKSVPNECKSYLGTYKQNKPKATRDRS